MGRMDGEDPPTVWNRSSRVRSLAGVDVGGTFTDIALWDPQRERVEVHKLLTTPDDPTRAVVEGLAAMTGRAETVIHGTTLVTNALVERKGALTGLVTTDGYRDVLETGSEVRYDTFDLFLARPPPLVPRRLRRTVQERIGADGIVVQPLDEEAVRQAAAFLADAGVEAVAVAFFNSYRNPEHERRAAEILRQQYPRLVVCASAEVAPEIRELERFSTGVANAYVQPLASRYLVRLAEALRVPLLVMLSDGGIATARAAAEQPISLVESGPAAGAMAAAHLAREARWADVIAFDMGGTTAKISLVHDGVPQRTHDLEVARVHRFKKGSGLPLRLPVVHLIEIGAGGGSLAWIDRLGLLKVGPQSAGARPGPACYGQGGEEATVTDADLHLGYLNPDNFLGGRLRLDPARSEAVLQRLAERLGISRTAAATGIAEVVDNNMATAARIHIAEQGRDPRRYRLVAFGGAGPVHAHAVARLLHIQEVVFPRAAGVASALGMLVAPRSVEYTRSLICPLPALDWDQVAEVLAELESRARQVLREAGVADEDVRFELGADIRYAGQGYEVTVPLERELVQRRDSEGVAKAFEAEYQRRFDRSLPGLPAEAVSWRLRALSTPAVRRLEFDSAVPAGGRREVGQRLVYFPEFGRFEETPVYQRASLRSGDSLEGPAVVEEAESSIVAGIRARLEVDGTGNLLMQLR